MEGKKIIVTGGAGFIGSHLVEELVKNHSVLVLDNLKSGKEKWISDKAEFKRIDISQKSKVIEITKKFNPDFIYHLAAFNDAMESRNNIKEVIDSNIIGTASLLEAGRLASIDKFIYTNSGGLSYGNPKSIPTKESENLKPVYPYGVSKTTGELLINDQCNRKDMDYVSLRLGSVYGPRATGGVIKNFFECIKRNDRPTIFGDGEQTRDFVHVEDVIDALIKAMKNGYGTYNIGTNTETSILELWKTIAKETRTDLEPIKQDRWEGDIDRCNLSISKAKKDLEWKPKINLKEGIRDCKKHYL